MSKEKLYTHNEAHEEWMKNPEYAKEYDALELEFQIAKAIIDERLQKGVTQEELARRADTGQAVISRLENMQGTPSLSLVQKVAHALGMKVQIELLPYA